VVYDCLFELADMWCTDISAEEYAPRRPTPRPTDGPCSRAAALGAFYTVPVLYLGPGMNASAHTIDVLTSSSMIRTRAGAAVPMAPLLSWIFFGPGSPQSRCAVPVAETQSVLDAVVKLNNMLEPQPLPIPVVSFWSGSDADTVNTTHCSPVAQLAYLTGGHFVPARCLPH
jgi:hypothetical protein